MLTNLKMISREHGACIWWLETGGATSFDPEQHVCNPISLNIQQQQNRQSEYQMQQLTTPL